jgi:hypothetical protein
MLLLYLMAGLGRKRIGKKTAANAGEIVILRAPSGAWSVHNDENNLGSRTPFTPDGMEDVPVARGVSLRSPVSQALELLGLSERRAHRRIACSLDVVYRTLPSRSVRLHRARALDLSPGGLRLATIDRVSPGRLLAVMIAQPGAVFSQPILGRVVCSIPTPDCWMTGVAFARRLSDAAVAAALACQNG